jgi:hypothetical protein
MARSVLFAARMKIVARLEELSRWVEDEALLGLGELRKTSGDAIHRAMEAFTKPNLTPKRRLERAREALVAFQAGLRVAYLLHQIPDETWTKAERRIAWLMHDLASLREVPFDEWARHPIVPGEAERAARRAIVDELMERIKKRRRRPRVAN